MNFKKVYIKFLTAAVISALTSGCMDIPGKLVMPEWDVDLNLPVADKLYTVNDIIKKQNYISINSSDSLYVIQSDKYDIEKSIVEFINLDQAITSVNNLVSPTNGTSEVFLNFRSDKVNLESAVFQTGALKITARNNSELETTISFVTPGIVNQGGQPFNFSFKLSPGERTTRTEHLDNFKYLVPASQPEIFKDQFWIIAKTQSSGISTADENVGFDVEISDFLFKSVTGNFPTFSLGKQTSEFNINTGNDAADFRDKVSLKGAKLTLTSQYNSVFANSFELLLDSLNIIGKSSGRKFYLKDSTGSEFINLSLKHGTSSVVFDEHNSNIEDLVSTIPEAIEINAVYKIVGSNSYGTVTNNDSVKFSVDFVTTSQFSLSKTTITDTVAINLNSDDRSNIADGQAANLTVQVENAVPLTSEFKIIFTDKNYSPLFELTNNSGSNFQVNGAPVDNISGNVISPSLNSQFVTLNSQQIKQLSEAYFALVSTSIMTTGSDNSQVKVAVHSNDWIKLKVFGGVKYRIKN